MIKERHIVERYSKNLQDPNGEPILKAYSVSIHYTQDGVEKHYQKDFAIKHYLNKTAALKDAVKHRNKIEPVIERKTKLLPGEKEVYTVGELFEMTPNFFPRTQGTYRKNDRIYNTYIKRVYENTPITDIGIEEIQGTLQICAANCVQQQVRNVKTDWHRIFQVAIIKRIPVTDWTQVIDTPISNKVTERSMSEQNITEENFQKFCEFMSGYGGYLPSQKSKIYNRDIITLMLRFMRVTGLRPQEAKAIRRSDVSFDTTVITNKITGESEDTQVAYVAVMRSIGSSFTEKLTEKQTKTPQSRRVLPVFDAGVDIIKQALEYSVHDMLFADYDGNPFHSDYISDFLYRVSKACGIKVYAGLMRKSFSADNYANGTNPAAIKKMMGHKNENMSVNWYATAASSEVQEAMKNRKYKQ